MIEIDTTAPWQLNDFVTTLVATSGFIVAIASLILSIWNFRRSTYFSERAYILAYVQELRNWAAEVLNIFTDIDVIGAKTGISDVDRNNLFIEVQRRAIGLFNQGLLLLPPTTRSELDPDGNLTSPKPLKHPLLVHVSLLQSDISRLIELAFVFGEQSRFDQINFLTQKRMEFSKLEQVFVNEVRPLLQIDLRYRLLSKIK